MSLALPSKNSARINVVGVDLTPNIANMECGMVNTVIRLLNGLPRKLSYQLVLFVTERARIRYEKHFGDRFTLFACENPIEYLQNGKIDVLHSPFNCVYNKPNGAISLLTKHDMIPVHFPNYFSALDIEKCIQQTYEADYIHAISNYTKRDIVDISGFDPDKIQVIYNAFGSKIAGNLSDEIKGIVSRFFIYPAAGRPHKNHIRLLDALVKCNDEFQVVLTTGEKHGGERFTKIKEAVNERLLENRVLVLGHVSDEAIAYLYENAIALLYPSLAEGFGFPLIEAMQYDLPILCSYASCIPEIAGEHAHYFDPYNVDSISSVITQFLSSSNYPVYDEESRERFHPFVVGAQLDWLYKRLLFKSEKKNILAKRNLSIKRRLGQNNIISENKSRLSVNKLTLLLDCSRLFDGNMLSGISKYIANLAIGLLKSDFIDLIPFYDSHARGYRGNKDEKIKSLSLDSGNTIKLYPKPWAEKLVDKRFAIYHSPFHPLPDSRMSNLAYCLTIHDILHVAQSHFYRNHKNLITPQIIHSIMPGHDEIIAVSEFSANELQKYLNSKLDITIGYLAPFCDAIENKKERKFLLVPFQADPRKNFDRMLKVCVCYASCETQDVTVCFFGKVDQLRDAYREDLVVLESNSKVIYYNKPTDAELSKLYSESFAFLYLSHGEGFGLPPLEAMVNGCAPIVFKNSSLKEVYHDWEFCVDEDISDLQLASTIMTIRRNIHRYKLSFDVYSERYSKDNMIASHIAAYASAFCRSFGEKL